MTRAPTQSGDGSVVGALAGSAPALALACSLALAGCGGSKDAPAPASTAETDGAAPPPARFASRTLATPPSYTGTLDDAAGCTQHYRTTGFEPVDGTGGRHPLFLYFVGTTFFASDASSRYDCEAGKKVTEAMARRGFVALSVEYDNTAVAWLSDHENQLACLFGAENAENVLAVACALPGVDCDLGIATWGHSQGALVADLAAMRDPRVRAVWATGYGGDPRAALPRTRFRLANGEGDTGNAVVASLNSTAGFGAAECPDDGRTECLRADGSGWMIVKKIDCALTAADHCWFDKLSCAASGETLEPNWVDPASTKPWALETNADWVAETAQRP